MENEDGNNSIRNINIECSPSYLINNLAFLKDTLFFIHNSESLPRVISVNKRIISEKMKNKFINIFNNGETNEMLFVKTISFTEGNYIAIGLYNGFKLFNTDGSRLLFQISEPKINKNKIYAFISCCGFELFDNQGVIDSILAGDNYGQLFLIHGTKSNWKSRKIYVTPRAETILSIAGCIGTKKIGITLDNGNVMIFNLENGECKLMKEFGNEYPSNIAVNSLAFANQNKNDFYLVCGFVNGEIKIYSMNNLIQKFSIKSNLRSVGPMIMIRKFELVTGSDDGQVIIWKYDENEDKITLKNNYLFEDKMIVGLAYDENSNNLYVNAFDSPEITIISDV